MRDTLIQTGELPDLVLAWLDEHARSDYIAGGFERLHPESVLDEDFLKLLPCDPATLTVGREYAVPIEFDCTR